MSSEDIDTKPSSSPREDRLPWIRRGPPSESLVAAATISHLSANEKFEPTSKRHFVTDFNLLNYFAEFFSVTLLEDDDEELKGPSF